MTTFKINYQKLGSNEAEEYRNVSVVGYYGSKDCRNLGMTVAQSTVLRQKMRDAGATYKVTKNRLARIARATSTAGMSTISPALQPLVMHISTAAPK